MLLDKIKNQKPIVLCLTNTVTENFCANVLLAIGASPIMSHAIEEVKELVSISQGLVINIGTLSKPFLSMTKHAIDAANAVNIPILFDPVGAGASLYRLAAAQDIIQDADHLILKCNASELMALAGEKSKAKGVDSGDPVEIAVELAKQYLSRHASVKHIIITGSQDHVISDGLITKNISGSPLMARVTGMGCALSGYLLAGYISVQVKSHQVLFEMLQFYTQAGERAAVTESGVGSFSMAFLDELSR